MLPQPGESIAASETQTHNGGKGANQAVALARLGQRVSFVGRVGDDADGQQLEEALVSEGIDVSGLETTQSPTGLAVILVDDAGANMIIVNQGANADVTAEVVAQHGEVIARADAVLVQMEIQPSAVEAALNASTGLTVLNPAPARRLDAAVLDNVDYLIPNETELGTLAGVPTPTTRVEVLEAIKALEFGGTVVVTLGADGAVAVVDGQVAVSAKPPTVDVVDTVGAGDAFCAGFTASIAEGATLAEAISFAVACGSHATTIEGAQPSMPTRPEADTLAASVSVDTVAQWSA